MEILTKILDRIKVLNIWTTEQLFERNVYLKWCATCVVKMHVFLSSQNVTRNIEESEYRI